MHIVHQSKVKRFYTGDGLEGKREKQTYSEDPEPPHTVTWINEEDFYYICSAGR